MGKPGDTFYHYPSVHGVLTIAASPRGLTRLEFGAIELEGKNAPTELTNRAASQVQEYLAGKRRDFDVALDLRGSAFAQAVWVEAAAIPYGQTRTCAQIAEAIGKPGSHRSVGTAIARNPLAPFIPTHRVEAPNATGQRAKVLRALQALEKRVLDD